MNINGVENLARHKSILARIRDVKSNASGLLLCIIRECETVPEELAIEIDDHS